MITLDQLIDQLRGINDELWQRLDAVESLHVPIVQRGHTRCLECTRDIQHPVAWPCDTIRAAQGDRP